MRIWSLHPKYLDTKGLVAAWREGLLAAAVADDPTRGYHNHSQLIRFKRAMPESCSGLLHLYLYGLLEEARARGFRFDERKLNPCVLMLPMKLTVTQGQFDYEAKWLQQKLLTRDPNMWQANDREGIIEPHPMFDIIDGDIEEWEKT